MKKLIAILCAAVLLATSIFGSMMLTVSAEDTAANSEVADTVVMPTFVDEDGDPINVYHTMENVPSSVVAGTSSALTVDIVENTTNLPVQALFSVSGATDENVFTVNFDEISCANTSGFMFYVEAPNFEPYTYTYDSGEDDEAGDPILTTATSDKFHLSIFPQGWDDDQGRYREFMRYQSRAMYTFAVGGTSWVYQSNKGYGVNVDAGFKGWIYCPYASLGYSANLPCFDTEDTIYSLQIKSLTSNASFDNGSTETTPLYGYIPEGEELIISAPIAVVGSIDDRGTGTGNSGDVAVKPSAEKVVVKGAEYYYNGSYENYSSLLGGSTVASSTVTNMTSNGTVTADSSKAPVTGGKMYKVSGLACIGNDVLDATTTATGNTAANSLLGEYTFNGSSAATGLMFYVKLKNADNPQFSMITAYYASDTATSVTYGTCRNSGAEGLIYYLPKGDSTWVSPAQANDNSQAASADRRKYFRDTGIKGDFEGYIYITWTGYSNSAPASKNLGFIQLYLSDNAVNSETSAPEDIYISDPILVNAFDATSRIAYNGGATVDMSSGEIINLDYTTADEFYGDELLINNGNNSIMSLDTLVLPNMGYTHIAPNGATDNYSIYSSRCSVEYIKSISPVIKAPTFKVTALTDVTYNSTYYLNMNKMPLKGVDSANGTEGWMLYVENPGDTTIKVSFQLTFGYEDTSDESLDYSATSVVWGGNKKMQYLEKGAYSWQYFTPDTDTRQMNIPAGFEGYLWIDFSGFASAFDKAVAANGYVGAMIVETTMATNDVIYISSPMRATNFTTDNAGMAFVNGSEVAQDMWTGDFTVPYDQNGSLTVDILDLVRAKANTDPDFTTFREAYLNDYFDDADYTVVSAAFSLRSLAYTDADASTILSENPDRGYRTEMVLYLKNGTPDPLYKSVYYVGDQTDEQENVSGLEFETREAAQAYINARVAEESTFKLTYYQNTDSEVATGTIEPQYTYAIDKEVYKTKTSYYVYRAFESYEDARAFMYEQMLLRGDSGYAIYTLYADTEEVDEDGNTIHNTYYRVGYDERCVFTGDSEEDQSKAIDRQIRKYFKIDLTDDYEEVMQEGIDSSKLTLTYLYLSDWNGASVSDLTAVEELPDSALDTVKLYFERMKKRGLKTEVRFSYNVNVSRTWRYSDANVTFNNGTIAETPNGTQPYNDDWLAENCANEGTILKHIEQLAPIVAEYKGSIHNISNGFIGYAGEMAYGYQYPAVDYVTVQKAIVEQLCVPNDLYFSTRSPSYRQMIANADADWEYLDSICINNDAIYGEQTNSGWNSGGYQVGNPENHTTDWWAWMTENAYKTPQGGETFTQKVLLNVDGNDVADYSKMLDGYDVMLELVHHRHTSFSYWHGYLEGLNKEYNIMKNWMNPDSEYYAPVTTEILENMGIAYDPAWFNGSEERNVYEFIRDHLGYRLVASKATVNYDKDKSDKVSVQMSFKNYGFAAAFNMSASLAILDRNGNVVCEKVAGDPSTWYNLAPDYYTTDRTSSAQGDVLTHNISAELDAPLAGGTYYLAFRLDNTADEAARLANDVEFVNGYNILGTFNFIG